MKIAQVLVYKAYCLHVWPHVEVQNYFSTHLLNAFRKHCDLQILAHLVGHYCQMLVLEMDGDSVGHFCQRLVLEMNVGNQETSLEPSTNIKNAIKDFLPSCRYLPKKTWNSCRSFFFWKSDNSGLSNPRTRPIPLPLLANPALTETEQIKTQLRTFIVTRKFWYYLSQLAQRMRLRHFK